MQSIKYDDDALNIRLKNCSPEVAHEGLMRAVVFTIKFQMETPGDISADVKEGNTHLLALLASILPDERQLQKAFK